MSYCPSPFSLSRGHFQPGTHATRFGNALCILTQLSGWCPFVDKLLSFPGAIAYAQLRIKAATPACHACSELPSSNVVTEGGEMVPTQLTISVRACTASGLFTTTRLALL